MPASGGLYFAQRRFRPAVIPTAGTWGSSVKHGYYDLEHRRIQSIEWGTGYGRYGGDDTTSRLDDHLSNVYLSALGGDWWDGAMEVE